MLLLLLLLRGCKTALVSAGHDATEETIARSNSRRLL